MKFDVFLEGKNIDLVCITKKLLIELIGIIGLTKKI